jgi:hypothetical protein
MKRDTSERHRSSPEAGRPSYAGDPRLGAVAMARNEKTLARSNFYTGVGVGIGAGVGLGDC